EPARGVDPHGQDAVRPWPALFAFADHGVAAADLVHADGLGRGAVRAAGLGRLVPALGAGMGTRRCCDLTAGGRCAYRRSHQAGLPRDPGETRTRAADSGAEASADPDADARVIVVIAKKQGGRSQRVRANARPDDGPRVPTIFRKLSNPQKKRWARFRFAHPAFLSR